MEDEEQRPIMVTAGEWLRHERKARGLAQHELERQLNEANPDDPKKVDQSVISKMERNGRFFHEATCKKIARLWGLPEEFVMQFKHRNPLYRSTISMRERNNNDTGRQIALMHEAADSSIVNGKAMHALAYDLEASLSRKDSMIQILSSKIKAYEERGQDGQLDNGGKWVWVAS